LDEQALKFSAIRNKLGERYLGTWHLVVGHHAKTIIRGRAVILGAMPPAATEAYVLFLLLSSLLKNVLLFLQSHLPSS
jgi:hypothetical protein